MVNKCYSVFDFSDAEERLIKNVRVVCRHAEGSVSNLPRRKFVAGLSKAGYRVPGVAWENYIVGTAMDHVFAPLRPDRVVLRTRNPYSYLAGAIFQHGFQVCRPNGSP